MIVSFVLDIVLICFIPDSLLKLFISLSSALIYFTTIYKIIKLQK
jgi:hypothetical protein